MKLKWISPVLLLALCTSVSAEESDYYVASEHITKHKGEPYQGLIDVSLRESFGVIEACIETQNLHLVSLTYDQLDNYVQLFGDPVAVDKYGDGIPWTRYEVESVVDKWVSRWETEQDPFSAFAIFEKKSNEFVGHIVLGHSPRYGQAEIAFLFTSKHHNIQYATQAVTAILYGYVPRLIQGEYLANLNSSVDPSPLRSIHGTSHFNDTFSGQAMLRSGMQIGESDILWDAQHFHYIALSEEILKSGLVPSNELYDTGIVNYDTEINLMGSGGDLYDTGD